MQQLTSELLEMADVHPDSRSYALSIEDFGRLCTAYEKLCAGHSGLLEYDFRYNRVPVSASNGISSDFLNSEKVTETYTV